MKSVYKSLGFLWGVLMFGGVLDAAPADPPLSSMTSDFPTVEKLEFKPLKSYKGLKAWNTWVIDGSVVYVQDADLRLDLGYCYDLNTGEKLSVLVQRGEAPHELSCETWSNCKMQVTKDFIVFVPAETTMEVVNHKPVFGRKNVIKLFGKRDIVENVPLKNRKVLISEFPDSVWVKQATILPNGNVVVLMSPPMLDRNKMQKDARSGMWNKTLMILDRKGVTYRETLSKDGFPVYDINGMKSTFDPYALMKQANADGLFRTRGNDRAVFALDGLFMLYTYDLNSGKVKNVKRYTDILFESGCLQNSMNLRVSSLEVTDTHILCLVEGYFSESDKQSNTRKKALFVFDWNLNPVKKFELKAGYYTIPMDGSAVYLKQVERGNENNTLLYKADLKL